MVRSLSGSVDQAHFSPDGRWVAYNTDESGRYEAKVVPFPPTNDKWQISKAGGMQPTWRGDGRQLYFLAPDGTLMEVDIRHGKTFEFDEPRPLFRTQIAVLPGTEQYAQAPEGGKFLFATAAWEGSSAPFTVVLNWTELLKK